MCFKPSSKFCLICLTLHTLSLTCLPTISNAHQGQDLAASQTTISSESLMPVDTSLEQDGHDHSKLADELSKAQKLYLKDLIERFGNNGVLTYDSIIHMLESLGMNPKVLSDHSHEGHSHHIFDSHAGHSHDADHSQHIHDSDHKKHNPETDHENHHHDDSDHEHDHDDLDHENHDHDVNSDHEDHDDHKDHHHSNNTNIDSHKLSNNTDLNVRRRRSNNHVIRQKRKTPNETVARHNHLEAGVASKTKEEKCDDLFSRFHIHPEDTVTSDRLLQMCPGILYTLSSAECRKEITDDHHHPVKQAVGVDTFKTISAEVWGYSTVAIVVISMVGLLGVAVVPIMQKVFYNHLLLFLVALAVGALSGDALLHLLPHALQGGHDHSSHGDSDDKDDNHKTAVLKGLCGMSAIFLFFTMERVLSIVTDLKRKHKKPGAVFVKESGDGANDNTSIPLTECGAMRVTDPDCKEQIMGIHPRQKALTNFAESSHKNCSREHESHSDKDRQFDMVDEENPSSVLSHSHHHHGHSHILPTSVASIAWMVILGDGIHNFCDGLAIGAAFSNSITGGFSTSVAVFCHELPHEIGDFAVLLRAGMTVKQAVMYNCVSSILAFIGMLIGVAIGNFGDSITWVFVSVAGMFLYIALVDMLPELTALDTRQGEHPFFHLLIQVGGMVLGASIMLIIALYEDNLMNLLEPV